MGGVFAFKVKDGPGGSEALWVVDVKNGKGSVTNDAGVLNIIGKFIKKIIFESLTFTFEWKQKTSVSIIYSAFYLKWQ